MTAPLDTAVVLERLQNGNAQYVAQGGKPSRPAVVTSEIEQARPIAAVVVCSDTKAFPEQVFGLEFGELLILQTPGNLVGDSEAAGVALAHQTDGVELVVVLGHSPCGVIETAASGDEGAFGAISRELHASSRRVSTDGARRGIEQAELARTHAARMAEVLRKKLAGAANISVAAAHFDETSGKVEFL